MNKIVVTCMDRRLGHKMDEYTEQNRKDGNSVTIIRNAGADIRHIMDSINQVVSDNKIGGIDLFTHTNCGACAVVYGVSSHKLEVSSRVNDSLVSQFMNTGIKFLSPQDVESVNMRLQREALQEFTKRGIDVHVESIDVSTLGVPEDHDEHLLVIGKPFSGRYVELAEKLNVNLWSMYCVNSESIIEVMPDIEIAVMNLNIRDLRIVATKQSEYRWAKEESERLKLMPFMRGIEAKVVEF